jgi:hypothetical protein
MSRLSKRVPNVDIELLEEEKDALAGKRTFLDDFVLPDYEASNIRNIKAIVGKIFDVGSLGSTGLPDDVVDDYNGVKKVLLVLMDGFGLNRLLAHVRQHDGAFAELVSKGVLKPFTSPFPATTSTSLTSIFTGLTPAEHGVLGYQLYSPQYGCVVNTLEMKPVYGYSSQVEIAHDLSKHVKPWAPTLQEQGVRTLIVTKGSIMGSGLSRVIHADLDVTPYVLESEMLVKCRRALEQPGPLFLVVYYSGIDTLEHKYGPYSEEVTSELESFEFLLQTFMSKLSEVTRQETLMMLTSDHGVQETQCTQYVKDVPEVWSRLQLPPVCDSRCGFLFAKQGEKENLRNAFERNINGFKLVASKELIEAGAFGQNAHELEPLLGDWAALSRGPTALSYPYYDDDRNREQHGGHGGMTAEEVLVPLLSMRL